MAPVPALPDSESRPDTKETEVAHRVLEAFGAHRATRAENSSTRQVLHIPREERPGLALTGRLLNPVQPARSPDAGAAIRMLNGATSPQQASANASKRIGWLNENGDRVGEVPTTPAQVSRLTAK